MNYQPFRYSLKVWLTSVLVAPAIYIIVQGYIELLDKNTSYKDYLNPGMYLVVAIFELIASFVIWLLFWGIIELIVRFCLIPKLKPWLIFVSGILLTIVPLQFMSGNDLILDYNNWLFIPMMANMFCIGCGCWIYKL